jgi:microcystin-dependent protein
VVLSNFVSQGLADKTYFLPFLSKGSSMSEPFLGEIKIVGITFPPRGWADCNGQLLPINQNQALYSLLGTNFGGDGRTNFGLPDLRGRLPVHLGSGVGLTPRSMGQKSGTETHAMSVNEMPVHSHPSVLISSTDEGDRSDPSGAYPARPEEPVQPYAGTTGGTMAPDAVQIGSSGNGIPANNMPPFLVLRFVIALTGIFPSRD